jgi:predicted NAD-dependent protein-ADP-ribosyltransferase YbiA (DUF1768 family)
VSEWSDSSAENRIQSLVEASVSRVLDFLVFLDDSAPHVILCCAGSQKLIEDSPTDSYWGCGRDGSGLNMLGVLLMELRATYVRSIALTSTGTVDLLTD